MGDIPPGSQAPNSFPGSPPVLGSTNTRLSTPGVAEIHETHEQHFDPSAEALHQTGHSPYQYASQQQLVSSYHLRQGVSPQLQSGLGLSQPNMLQAQAASRSSLFNMNSLGSALPDNVNYGQGFVQQSPQRFASGQQAGLVFPMQQPGQYPGQMGSNQPTNQQYNMQYQQQYARQLPAPIHPSGPGSQQFMQHPGFGATQHQQPTSPYYYQQAQYSPQGQVYGGTPAQQYAAQYSNRSNLPSEGGPSTQRGIEQRGAPGAGASGGSTGPGAAASSGGSTATLRGPPRKPKQSGHALWVGNLPPGANVTDLKEHFSRDATNDILSVFLISKSNCAFVNYKTEESCAAAMARFHDSRFQGVRLVCRLRRTSVNPVPGVPTGPAANSAGTSSGQGAAAQESGPAAQSAADSKEKGPEQPPVKDKYFIVKSLTVEDLDLSVRNGLWATQSHNEETLNKAFETAENVYLIFSANKSGEYFGYARMTAAIDDDPEAAIEFAPQPQAVEDSDLPKAIPTPATDFAPKGRIIDDSARGTIFWEAETDDSEGAGDNDEPRSEHSDHDQDTGTPSKAWGKPFRVEWISTTRLPFYRTRGLRNPWNSNREVKIARDGTELETSVGRRLTQMFHREASPTTTTMPPMPMMPPMMGGYPQMRQY